MQTPVSSIGAAKSSNNIRAIRTRINHFLDYAATHPSAKLKYIASNMCLWAHPDTSYLCETKGRSRAGAYVYLSSKPQSFPIRKDSAPSPHKAEIHVVCKVIDAVMSSAQEAEIAAGFLTTKESLPLR